VEPIGRTLRCLQHAQQFRLQIQRERAHVIEEERAAVRRAHEPLVRSNRATERALHVAKSSLSASEAGIVEQPTTTKLPALPAPFVCSKLATSSLPVPVSPEMSTVTSEVASCATRSRSSRNFGLLPTSSAPGGLPAARWTSCSRSRARKPSAGRSQRSHLPR